MTSLRPSALWTLLATLFCPLAGAQEARVDALGWMSGEWCLETEGGGSQEELWTTPAGGVMLGLHRDVSAAGKGSFEFLRVEEDGEGGLTYWASPAGSAPTPFRLTGLAGQLAVFENPEHDFPQKIVYWRAEHVLKARIEGTGGEPREFFWVEGPCDGVVDLPDDAR